MLSPVRMKAYHMQHQEFIDSILEDRAPSVTGEDGRAAVEVALRHISRRQKTARSICSKRRPLDE